MIWDVIVIGGGAAGFFGAINTKMNNDALNVMILEKGNHFLSKVKISGGGRCNVTHACFEPKELVKNYPRGAKELIGPFHQFQPGDVFDWFEQKNVPLKIEDDNRVFPEKNTSQAILDCFFEACKQYNITLKLQSGIKRIAIKEGLFELESEKETLMAKKILITTGSSPQFWNVLEGQKIDLVPPVPSLFTFNIKNDILAKLPGVSVPNAMVKVPSLKLKSNGPLLITHWGLSGPAILKMSAWGAVDLATVKYQFEVVVNWCPSYDKQELIEAFKELRETSKKQIKNTPLFDLPTRLWEQFVASLFGDDKRSWAEMGNKHMEKLASLISENRMLVNGKSTFKDEFVTAGGVELKEVDFKTMQLRKIPNAYVAGEVINVDAITGGFNFQAAWTTSWIAAKDMARK
jgi:predicted Rossmann fold flavoprotein